MENKLEEFKSIVHSGKLSLDGKTPDRVEVNDSTNVYQCMDLLYAWLDFLKIPRDTIRHLLAYQVWTEPNDLTIKYFEMIPNTPSGIPPVGSLVVFSTAIGGSAGHIAIGTKDSTINNAVTYDQNFGTDKTCRIVSHGYSAVLGWLKPRTEELSDDTKRALKLLEEYQKSQGLGTMEGAIRDLLGKANDIVAIKNGLLEYKLGEKNRIDSAVSTALSISSTDWQNKLDIANDKVIELNKRNEILINSVAKDLPLSMLIEIILKKIFPNGG